MWYSFTCGVHVGWSRKMATEGMLVFRLPSLLKWKLFCFLLRTPVKNFWDLYEKKLSAGKMELEGKWWDVSLVKKHRLVQAQTVNGKETVILLLCVCGKEEREVRLFWNRCEGWKEFPVFPFTNLTSLSQNHRITECSGLEGTSLGRCSCRSVFLNLYFNYKGEG